MSLAIGQSLQGCQWAGVANLLLELDRGRRAVIHRSPSASVEREALSKDVGIATRILNVGPQRPANSGMAMVYKQCKRQIVAATHECPMGAYR